MPDELDTTIDQVLNAAWEVVAEIHPHEHSQVRYDQSHLNDMASAIVARLRSVGSLPHPDGEFRVAPEPVADPQDELVGLKIVDTSDLGHKMFGDLVREMKAEGIRIPANAHADYMRQILTQHRHGSLPKSAYLEDVEDVKAPAFPGDETPLEKIDVTFPPAALASEDDGSSDETPVDGDAGNPASESDAGTDSDTPDLGDDDSSELEAEGSDEPDGPAVEENDPKPDELPDDKDELIELIKALDGVVPRKHDIATLQKRAAKLLADK